MNIKNQIIKLDSNKYEIHIQRLLRLGKNFGAWELNITEATNFKIPEEITGVTKKEQEELLDLIKESIEFHNKKNQILTRLNTKYAE